MDSIEVHYSPRQVSKPKTSSPSPRKPALVVADWAAQNLPVTIVEPLPVKREQLLLAHTPGYVDGILSCRLENGFGGHQYEVAESLPWTCGSLLSAACAALDNRLVACSPTSGFHHAGLAFGYGYCTFNGLMVAAMALKAEGKVQRVAILDCDQHYGDGTADIIARRQVDWIRHVSKERWNRDQAKPFLSGLLNVVSEFEDCDLLIYQAGADPHVEDPLGGFLTTAELALRDKIVFTVAKAMGLPVVWNLAGGYQEPVSRVLEIHRNTMAACAAAYL